MLHESTTPTTPTTPAVLGAEVIVVPMNAKAAVMKRLNGDIPSNEYGLLEYIYRADLIPTAMDELPTKERTDYMEAAIIELDYSQGFPTLPDGEPFWAQLPTEPGEAHRAFIHYLDMPRQKTTISGNINAANAVRQVHALKDIVGQSTHTLLSYAHMYYWQQRAMAYDLFITASHNKRREYMLQDVENEHLATSAKFIKYAEQFLDAVFAEPEKYELKPREAMDLLLKMIQVQRLSLGATPFGQKSGKTENELPQNASLEVILRTLVQQSGAGVKPSQQAEDLTKQLFDNPDDLRQAQELIIRLGDAKNPRTGRNTRTGNNSPGNINIDIDHEN